MELQSQIVAETATRAALLPVLGPTAWGHVLPVDKIWSIRVAFGVCFAQRGLPMAALPDSPAQNEVLNSWKDIARYLNRGVRTVQRWELELALPVRRPRGKPRSAVLALRSDLDRWLSRCPSTHAGASPEVGWNAPLRQTTSELIAESRQLRADLSRVRTDLNVAVRQLTTSMRPLRVECQSNRAH